MAEFQNNKPPFSRSNPDFTQVIWPTIEEKLGRKLTPEENCRFMYRGGGMFKEWFFNSLKKCSTAAEAEDLFARAIGPWATSEPKAPHKSFLQKILELFGW